MCQPYIVFRSTMFRLIATYFAGDEGVHRLNGLAFCD